jgi:hypothetical protein
VREDLLDPERHYPRPASPLPRRSRHL